MCSNFLLGGLHARDVCKDPESQFTGSPTLYATDRTDRNTYIVQGWVVTDPAALADIGDVPPGEMLIEVPAEVLRFAVQHDRRADS